MMMQAKRQQSHHPTNAIVYMEVYGSNRVIYRVTAGSVVQGKTETPTYGVILEDMRSGEIHSIADFSEDLEQTIVFANDLVGREIRPSGLYDVALEYLCANLMRQTAPSHQVSSSRKIFSR